MLYTYQVLLVLCALVVLCCFVGRILWRNMLTAWICMRCMKKPTRCCSLPWQRLNQPLNTDHLLNRIGGWLETLAILLYYSAVCTLHAHPSLAECTLALFDYCSMPNTIALYISSETKYIQKYLLHLGGRGYSPL